MNKKGDNTVKLDTHSRIWDILYSIVILKVNYHSLQQRLELCSIHSTVINIVIDVTIKWNEDLNTKKDPKHKNKKA